MLVLTAAWALHLDMSAADLARASPQRLLSTRLRAQSRCMPSQLYQSPVLVNVLCRAHVWLGPPVLCCAGPSDSYCCSDRLCWVGRCRPCCVMCAGWAVLRVLYRPVLCRAFGRKRQKPLHLLRPSAQGRAVPPGLWRLRWVGLCRPALLPLPCGMCWLGPFGLCWAVALVLLPLRPPVLRRLCWLGPSGLCWAVGLALLLVRLLLDGKLVRPWRLTRQLHHLQEQQRCNSQLSVGQGREPMRALM
jgi:hypothetical protein